MRPCWRRRFLGWGLLFLGLCLVGCGGQSGPAGPGHDAPEPAPEQGLEPAPEQGQSPDDDEAGGSQTELIPARKLEEIERFFQRKNRFVSRCFNDALEAGEIPKGTRRAYITVSMTIARDGTPQNLRVAEASVSSPTLERCVRDRVSKWTITALPKALDYSYSFGFTAL